MTDTTLVGIDLAMKISHVTAMDDGGQVVERKRIRCAQLQSYLALLPPGVSTAVILLKSADRKFPGFLRHHTSLTLSVRTHRDRTRHRSGWRRPPPWSHIPKKSRTVHAPSLPV